MRSIEECRKILVDDNETYTDEEIKFIREHLYKMATTAKKHSNKKSLQNEKI